MKKSIICIMCAFSILFCSTLNVSANQRFVSSENYEEIVYKTVTKVESSVSFEIPAYGEINANGAYTGTYVDSDGNTGSFTFSQYYGSTHETDGYLMELNIHYMTNISSGVDIGDISSTDALLYFYSYDPVIKLSFSSDLVDAYDVYMAEYVVLADGTKGELIKGTSEFRTQHLDYYTFVHEISMIICVRSTSSTDDIISSNPTTHSITVTMPEYSYQFGYYEVTESVALDGFWMNFQAYMSNALATVETRLKSISDLCMEYLNPIYNKLSDVYTVLNTKVSNYLFYMYNMFYDEDGQFWINFDTKLTDILEGYWSEDSPTSDEVSAGIGSFTQIEDDAFNSAMTDIENFDFEQYSMNSFGSGFTGALLFVTGIMENLYSLSSEYGAILNVTFTMLLAAIGLGLKRFWR